MIETPSLSRKIFLIINTIFLIFFSFCCIAPLIHIFMASVSDPRELMNTNGLLLWPAGKPTFKGYQLIFKNKDIFTGYMNILIYEIATTVICNLGTLIAGYVISKKNLRLAKPITAFILITMMFNGGLIPSYMVNRALHLVNTRWAIILPGVLNAFYIIVIKSAFEQLPGSFEESAIIDGAGPVRTLFFILAPLIKATIVVIIMFNIVQQWNSWFPASIYLTRRRDLWPLQLFIKEVLVQNDISRLVTGTDALGVADFTSNLVKYGTAVIGVLPMLLLYPFAQKYFVEGATLGGVKG